MGQSDVLKWFQDRGEWCNADDAAKCLDRDRRNLQKVLAKLVKNGDLEVERPGQNKKYRYRYIYRASTNSSLGLATQESQTDSEATG